MNTATEENLISKIRDLTPQQIAEVEDFVEFLFAKSKRRDAMNRLLAIAPALASAGATPLSDEEIASEIDAARKDRREKRASEASRADRS